MTALRLRALSRAKSYVGTKEVGWNRGALIDQWNKTAGVPVGSPYCDSFVHSMYHALGYELGGGAYCPATLSWGEAKGYGVLRPYRGDNIYFDWNQDGVVDHTGFVDRVLSLRWFGKRFIGLVRTVEANTGSGLAGNQSEGDGVYIRYRWVNSSTRFLRIPG